MTITITEMIRARQDRFRRQLPSFGFDSLITAARLGRWYDRSELRAIEADVLKSEIAMRLRNGPEHYMDLATKADARGDTERAYAYRQEAAEIARHKQGHGEEEQGPQGT